MQQPKPPKKQTNCHEHDIEIEKLKKDMETLIRHDGRIEKAIQDFDMALKDINVSILKINATLDVFKDHPAKIRKLEDKNMANSVIEKILWLAVGAFITVFIHQNYIATTREKDEYRIEKSK